jgi:hypothetical protein
VTWLGKWLQSVAGTWFGTDEPEAPGAMRATLRGSSSVAAGISVTQTQPIEQTIAQGTGSVRTWRGKQPQPYREDEELALILALMEL